MIAWRSLFDSLRVPWKDRGSNCSRGHINIRCPWCGLADPSQHLTINEESGAYYCLRTPGKTHSGRSLPWLLLGLDVDSRQIDGLIEEHSDRRRQPPQLVAAPSRILDWHKFEIGSGRDEVTEYLSSRGFDGPREVAARFGLRFTQYGRFSWRVLLPLTCPKDRGEVLAFTGRALRGQQPRYLTNDPMEGSLYVPPRARGSTVIVALLGTALPAEKKLHLAEVCKSAPSMILCEGPFDALTLAWGIPNLSLVPGRVLYVPDADQSVSDTYRLIEELEGIPGMPRVVRFELPRGYGDIGAMAGSRGVMERWLS